MSNTDRKPEAGALGFTGSAPTRIATRWQEQYARMKRWHSRISDATTVDSRAVDDVYAFFVCCYHLKDWIRNDDSVAKRVSDEVERAVSQSVPLCLSADITNGFKHLKRTKPVRISADATVKAVGTSLDSFDLDTSLLGGIVVVVDGTNELDMRGVADGCVEAWDAFLTDRGLPPPVGPVPG